MVWDEARWPEGGGAKTVEQIRRIERKIARKWMGKIANLFQQIHRVKMDRA